jgi:succinate dehydrogenase / fumarate reductase, cytochrome b subunit
LGGNGNQPVEVYLTTTGGYISVEQTTGTPMMQKSVDIKHRTEFYDTKSGLKIGEGYKDLYKITVAFFKDAQYGLIATILYVIAMITLGFHLYHGFGSAFQSLGANNPKYNGLIRNFGYAFAIVVPLLFAVIPVFIHFFLK